MTTIVAHTPPGENVIAVFTHVLGGAHYLLALVAAGLTSVDRRGWQPTVIGVQFATVILIGVAIGFHTHTPIDVGLLGLVAALGMGLNATASTWTPLHVTRAGTLAFAACYGAAHGRHLLWHAVADGGALAAALVATAGSFIAGAIAGRISDETDTRRSATVAIGVATVVVTTGSFAVGG